MRIRTILAIFFLITISVNLYGQVTNALNRLFPLDLIDKRSQLSKSVMGIGSSVNVTLVAGIKYIDACQKETDFGNLKAEIRWSNSNDETGKFTLQMMKDMNVAKQEKENFMRSGNEGKIEDFARGTLKISSETKACVNEMTGKTGELEYITEARFFSFNENRMLFITFSDKMKPETAKNIILKVADEVARFDFSVFGNTIANE